MGHAYKCISFIAAGQWILLLKLNKTNDSCCNYFNSSSRYEYYHTFSKITYSSIAMPHSPGCSIGMMVILNYVFFVPVCLLLTVMTAVVSMLVCAGCSLYILVCTLQ